jgi:hypothetical protein
MSNVSGHDSSKRKFIKKLAYVPPVILTLGAVPSYATTGSPRNTKDDKENHYDKHDKYKSNDKKRRHGWFHNVVESVKKEAHRYH